MTSANSGRLYTLDGIDGVGKTTQISRLAEHLRKLGRQVETIRDPGGTPVGSHLRRLLLDSDLQLTRRTEAMLFMASRCEMVETEIGPWLSSGTDVICDRFLLSNVVYQSLNSDGTDGSLSTEDLWTVGRWSIDQLMVEQTFLLDMPATESLRRVNGQLDRMEQRGQKYLEAVRQRYRREVIHASKHYAIIDASQPVDAVTDAMLSALKDC